VRLYQEKKDFLRFLRTAAQKHSVTVSFSSSDTGTFTVSVPGKDRWNLDSFLQEIIPHRGLYYYLCGVLNRREVAKDVVMPIFKNLQMSRFSVTYPVQILKHLMAGAPHWAGGELLEPTAHQFEILFQKLNLKEVRGYEFVRDTDDLITQWMLNKLKHPKGSRSPKFNALIGMCTAQNILRSNDVRKLFGKVHSMRTRGLHRQIQKLPRLLGTSIRLSNGSTTTHVHKLRRLFVYPARGTEESDLVKNPCGSGRMLQRTSRPNHTTTLS
jgi:hypothetical protein